MSEVKRYGISAFEGGMDEMSDGNWIAAEDFDAEHALRLEAERKVAELRDERDILQRRIDRFDKTIAGVPALARSEQLHAENKVLQTRLDTAMGLLREVKPIEDELYSAVPYNWYVRRQALLNTTSTEGKDHG